MYNYRKKAGNAFGIFPDKSLKVKLLQHSPHYATNIHYHALVCKRLY